MKNSIKKYLKNTDEDENYSMICEKEKESENENQNENDNGNEEQLNQENIEIIKDEKLSIKENNSEKNDESAIIDDYNIDKLIKKIKDTENKISNQNIIIDKLKKEIEEKENKIKKITNINNKLQQSLNNISKEMDNKLFNNKGIYENLKKYRYNIKNNFDNKNSKEKELNNAINIIKILKKDNLRLQSSIDNYEKINKLKDLENINKIKADENCDLENQIKILKKELNNYNLCLKKCKIYETQISILHTENKSLKDKIKLLNNKLNDKINNENEKEYRKFEGILSQKKNNSTIIKLDRTPHTDRYKINSNIYNKNISSLKLNHRTIQHNSNSLPKINSINKTPLKSNSDIKINISKKNYGDIGNILKIFFNEEEIDIINTIFKNNLNDFENFKKKLYIINKSKESLNNKYNLEIKKYNERIISAQEQIDYLNNKIRENEVNYRILQSQMNESNIQKKLLQKKIKILKEDIAKKDKILKINFAEYEYDINNNNKINFSKNENSLLKDTDNNGISNIQKIDIDTEFNNKNENSQTDNESNDNSFMKEDE